MVSRKQKTYIKILTILILFILGYFNQDVIVEETNKVFDIKDKLSNSENSTFENGQVIYSLSENIPTNLQVEFCPSQDCFNLLTGALNSAKQEIKCAFYELDEQNLSNTLLAKSQQGVQVSLVIDNNYIEEQPLIQLYDKDINIYSDVNRGTRYNNYMHNKFCIIDNNIIIAGSTNPTTNGLFKNNNNMLVFKSEYLAKNFENEFDQLASGVFGEKKESVLQYNNITLIYQNESYLVSSYFCPQDDCDEVLIKYVNSAKKEILFATFALTLDELKDSLIKQDENNINIQGVIEKRNVNLKGSDITELRKYFDIKYDTNSNNMHHKFFVIDENTIITGSMNPSASGANYNDEHMLVIQNKDLAMLYKHEFEKLYS